MKIKRINTKIYPSVEPVISRYLHFQDTDRISSVFARVSNLTEKKAEAALEKAKKEFCSRHRNLEEVFQYNFLKALSEIKESADVSLSDIKKELIGAYFSMEYSFQSTALFNPSIVQHPDQSGLAEGERRFLMSLRATGEGHISSLCFKQGVVDKANQIQLEDVPNYHTALKRDPGEFYEKSFLRSRAITFDKFRETVLDGLPERFTKADFEKMIENFVDRPESHDIRSVEILRSILDANYHLEGKNIPIEEMVIFPNSVAEIRGIEDVRFVRFPEQEETKFYGTYSAFDGFEVGIHLIETKDFSAFEIRRLYGKAISDKGAALFPEKINGRYVMIGRQGGQDLSLMYSDDLYHWDEYEVLAEPLFDWDLLQLGNCGSPVKTEKGWLLLIHGVGPMRKYVISMMLLDLDNPAIILGRLNYPLIEPEGEERNGYVPNVVYSCGMMTHHRNLIIPFAISDSVTSFASISIDDILNEFEKNEN